MSDDNLRKYYANQLKRQEYLKIGFKQGFEAGYAKAKEDFGRPQGEWGKDIRLINYLTRKCLECGKNSAVGNFCMWCGSDMRPRISDEAVDGEGKDGNVKEGDAE